MSQEVETTHSTGEQKEAQQRVRTAWLAIIGLMLLSALPVIGGAFRLGEVSTDAESTLPLASLIAIVAHTVAMSVYCLLGAFQFSPALRIRRSWHRIVGRALIPAGLIAALSAVWLAVFFGAPANELALAMVRLVFAVVMTVSLLLGTVAIKRRDFVAHGAWATRAYAIAVAGGTQALVVTLWTILVAEVDATGETRLVAAGFVINIVVAELLIRRRSGRRMRGMSVRGALVS